MIDIHPQRRLCNAQRSQRKESRRKPLGQEFFPGPPLGRASGKCNAAATASHGRENFSDGKAQDTEVKSQKGKNHNNCDAIGDIFLLSNFASPVYVVLNFDLSRAPRYFECRNEGQ